MNEGEEKLVCEPVEVKLEFQVEEEKGDNNTNTRQLPVTEMKRPPYIPQSFSSEQKPGEMKLVRAESVSIEEGNHAVSFPDLHPIKTLIKAQKPPSFIDDTEQLKSQKTCKSNIRLKSERKTEAQLLEHIKARKYTKEFFEKCRKEQIGLTTLVGPRRETTIIKLNKGEAEEAGGQMQFERPPSMDSNEQIQNMDILLNTIDKNTTLKVKLEKAIIEFNQSPNKAFEFLWREQIVIRVI